MLQGDERGHLLAVSGVLLVLGFMVIAPLVAVLTSMEDAQGRQKEGLAPQVEALLAHLNETLSAATHEGSDAIEYFMNVSTAMQEGLQEDAAKAGLYASVALVGDPDPRVYQRPSRCQGNNPDQSAGGVVFGWSNESLLSGIAGAVYDVQVTDGHQSFSTVYYLRVFECVRDVLFTHAVDAWASPGSLTGLEASRTLAGGVMVVTETNEDEVLMDVSPTIDPDSFRILHWNQPGNLVYLDGQTAKHPSNEAPKNHIHFSLLPPTGMQNSHVLEEPVLVVTASDNMRPSRSQELVLNVYFPADATEPSISRVVGPLTTTLQPFEMALDEGPMGTPGWSLREIEDSRWELTVTGSHNPGREVYVDHVNMTGGMWMASPYRLQAEIQWQEVPSIFTAHELHLHYEIKPGTPRETFPLLVRDVGPGGNGTWWQVAVLEDTRGDVEVVVRDLPLAGDAVKRLEFRIVDTEATDNLEPDDRDTIHVHLLRIRSTVPDS